MRSFADGEKIELWYSAPRSQRSSMEKKCGSFGDDMHIDGCCARYSWKLLVPDFGNPGTTRLQRNCVISRRSVMLRTPIGPPLDALASDRLTIATLAHLMLLLVRTHVPRSWIVVKRFKSPAMWAMSRA